MIFFGPTPTNVLPLSIQMSSIPMKTRKTTKKAAAVKRGHKIATTYTVADLRSLLQEAAGALIAIDHWLDVKVEQLAKENNR